MSRVVKRQAAEGQAKQAWAAYVAMVRAETHEPALRANPYWLALRDTAHARFRAIYESEAMR